MAIASWLRCLPILLLLAPLPPRRRKRAPVRRGRPRLEPLEERALPSTIFWINPSGGDWDTGSNWLGGNVPGPGDTAVITLPGITVTHTSTAADSVGGLLCTQTLKLSAGSLALAAPSNIYRLNLAGGKLIDPTSVTLAGLFTWTGGTLNVGQVNANGGMWLAGPGPLYLDGTILKNSGAATWLAGDVYAAAGSALDNLAAGTFTDLTNSTFHGTFNNAGRFTVAGGALAHVNTLHNSGSVTVQSGALNVGSYTQSGGITSLGNHSLTAADLTWTGGTLSGNGGVLSVTSSMNITGSSPLTLDRITLVNGGTAVWSAGDIGTVIGSTFINQANATFTAQSDTSFHTNFDNAGTFVLAGIATTHIDTLANSGVVVLQSGNLDVTTYSQSDGSTYLEDNTLTAANPVQINGGGLIGGGTINGDVVNNGLVNPGGVDVLTINGNYTQTPNGSLWMAIGGADPSLIDQLFIAATAFLGGSLNARFINGFTPGPQDSYTLVSAGAVTNPFDAVFITNPSNTVNLQVVYSAASVAIAAVVPPPPSGGGSPPAPIPPPTFVPDLAFAVPGLLPSHVSQEIVTSVAVARLSGGAGRSETSFSESIAKADRALFAPDLWRGVGSADMVESGADDDLVEALLASINELDRAMESDVLSISDLGASMLTRQRPKADILPQKGSRVAAVGTLLPADVDNAMIASPGDGDEEPLLKEFLIDPVRRPPQAAPAPKATVIGQAGGPVTIAEPARSRRTLSLTAALASGPLLLGGLGAAKGRRRQRATAKRRWE